MVGICIDFMANVSLPCIPVQDTYYFRQFTVKFFGFHNLASREVTVSIYHYGERGKVANENFIHFWGQLCGPKQKQYSGVRMMIGLCESKRFNDIKVTFLDRGHSFMPFDRDFGIIRRKLRKEERCYTVDEVAERVKHSSKNLNKFSIVKMKVEYFIDYSSWWPKFYKRTCLSDDPSGKAVSRDLKMSFTVSKYHEMR
ncbi:hypothetical protein PR048_005690 [Dryococelus australis]|uniref:DUF7869 domain-containing protein n=1 Tax=Dryococelus australis TaxID=614101 RepID=A0ABQ9I9G3_9NEOP|nr:hypothetical protein PR048_005690 [Dryococelus australis]